jgi:hypothetical protein
MNANRTCLPSVYALLALTAAAALFVLPAYAAGETPKGPSDVIFIGQILALMITGRLMGEAMLRLGQPAIIPRTPNRKP